MEDKTIVAQLRELLGSDVLLLHCKTGTKRPVGKWKDLTSDSMADPAYLAKLARGNIGVALGQRSGGLCSLDIDSDDEFGAFVKLNERLCQTLCTRGARGGNLWWRIEGEYPRLTPLNRTGGKWGEWRADGAQTIIWGLHPGGNRYQFLRRSKPRMIAFGDIRWPANMTPMFALKLGDSVTETTELTERTEATEPTERTEQADAYKSGECVGGVLTKNNAWDEAINIALPTQVHTSHERLFLLARAVKAIEAQRGKAVELAELLTIFNTWYQRAKPFLRSDESRDEYYLEFLEGYENAMHALGINAVDVAWDKAQVNPLPQESLQFEDGRLRLLVSLCRELALIQGTRPFFLSCRTVQRLLSLPNTMLASRWLNGLRRAQLLTITEKGGPNSKRATRFLYRGEM